jgi:hypothetical protein
MQQHLFVGAAFGVVDHHAGGAGGFWHGGQMRAVAPQRRGAGPKLGEQGLAAAGFAPQGQPAGRPIVRVIEPAAGGGVGAGAQQAAGRPGAWGAQRQRELGLGGRLGQPLAPLRM